MSGPDLTPWTVTATRVVLKDRWIEVAADECVTGDGTIVAPFYVLRPRDWAVILAVDQDDHAILVRQYRHPIRGLSLELPGGVVDTADASPAITAVRELREETGHSAEALVMAGRFAPNPANQTNTMHVFATRGARLTDLPRLDIGETLAVERVPLPELRRLALSGGIVHGLHVAAILMALAAFDRQDL